MLRRIALVLALAGEMLALAGCVSLKRTPEARYFALRSVTDLAQASPGESRAGVVGVTEVRVPRHLARQQLVIWSSPSELRIDEFARWAEPLDVALQQTLADDLAARLPGFRVVRRPWPSQTDLRCRVSLEISAFGMQETREVRLAGRWVLLPAKDEQPLVSRTVALARGPLPPEAAADPGATVEILNELVAELSGSIATAIRELPAEERAEPASEVGEAPAGAAPVASPVQPRTGALPGSPALDTQEGPGVASRNIID
jgi:uncharacterized protein